jgi:ribosome biogenesis GTPase
MKDARRMIARVVELHGQRAWLAGDDQFTEAIVKGKLKYADRGVSPVAVGDYVEYTMKTEKLAAIESITRRESVISKPIVEKEEHLQIMVSNVDRLVIVTSTRDPAFRPGLVDRFLVIAFKQGIKPVVVLNKIDLEDARSFACYFDVWRRISCDTVFASALTGEGVDDLARIMKVGTSVITGHSGVGKSSLLNRISPRLGLRTESISASSGRGVHTTSRISLFKLFADGWVADTPGLKVFGLAGVDRKSLHLYFPEFADISSGCQFNDCSHVDEPRCAIRKSVESADGEVAEFRYKSYLRILNSLKK